MQEHETQTEYTAYQTGAVQPRRTNNGILALLLVCVIFLGGVVSALSFMNIRLFARIAQLENDEPAPVSFSAHGRTADAVNEHTAQLGIGCCDVSVFWQNYHAIPAGVYVKSVSHNGAAAQSGIRPGDILLRFDGVQLRDVDSLAALLRQAGTSAEIVLHRKGETLRLTVLFS